MKGHNGFSHPVDKRPALHIKCDENRSAVICYLMGDLEHLIVGQFRAAVAELAGKKRVIFELSAVPFVDSAGLGVLIGMVRRIGGTVVTPLFARPGRR